MGKALHGIFLEPSDVKLGDFESKTGKKTAYVVNFVDIMHQGIDPQEYVEDNIDPIWDAGHIPLLTLEPSGGENVARRIADGRHDSRIDAWADAIKWYIDSNDGDARMYVRMPHEMNGDWYDWAEEPDAYCDMYRHIQDIIVQKDGVNREENLQFVWCPNADTSSGVPHVREFYPGSEYVDWVGYDGYNFGSKRDYGGWRSPSETFDGIISKVRKFAGEKPEMLVETASTAEKNGSFDKQVKADWIRDEYDYVDQMGIRGISWFNQDKADEWDSEKDAMDWSVFGYDREYGQYRVEATRDRLVGSHRDDVISKAEFHGNFSNGGDKSTESGEKDTMTRPTSKMVIKNGPNSTPVTGTLRVNGVIENNNKGIITFDVASSGGNSTEKTINFRGIIEDLSWDGQGSLSIDGESYQSDEVIGFDTRNKSSNNDTTSGDPANESSNLATPNKDTYEHNITFEGGGEKSGYQFAVSGGMKHSGALEGTVQSDDVIDQSFASGTVFNGNDSYKFDGDIHTLRTDGNSTTVLLDGNEISPSDYPSKFITVECDNGNSPGVEYAFEANVLEGITVENGGFNPGTDQIDEHEDGLRTTAAVGKGMDAYAANGPINWVFANEGSIVHVNGEEIDMSSVRAEPLTLENLDEEIKDQQGTIASIRQMVQNLSDSSGGSADLGGKVPVQNEMPELGVVERSMVSQGPVEYHVGNGSDATHDSVQDAVNDLPYILLHEVRIHIHGDAKGGRPAVHIGPFQMTANINIEFIGHDNASIECGSNVNITGKMDHIQWKDIEFNWISQCRSGRYVGCSFNGNGSGAFSGKMQGKMLIDCDVGSDEDDYGIWSIGNESVEIRNSTLRGKKAGVRAAGMSKHVFTGSLSLDAPEKVKGRAGSVYLAGEKIA